MIVLKLPEAPTKENEMGFYPIARFRKVSLQDANFGKFGNSSCQVLILISLIHLILQKRII